MIISNDNGYLLVKDLTINKTFIKFTSSDYL